MMYTCENCGNQYDKPFKILTNAAPTVLRPSPVSGREA